MSQQDLTKKSIYFFVGTIAELIKMAPIIKELKKRGISFKVISSGQRRINFAELKNFIGNISPNISFKERPNLPSIIFFIFWAARTLLAGLFTLSKEFEGLNKNNSYFIVHGDTVTSVIGSLIAKFYHLKLVHIEAGDYAFNFFEPFPEEIIRHINDHLSDVLFAPNEWALSNLKNLKKEKVNTQYNTLIESFWWTTKIKNNVNFGKYKKYYILLLHRQEHVVFRKKWSKETMEFVINSADKNLNCLLINHPLSINIINSLQINEERKRQMIIIPSLSYPDFMKLMQGAEFIATDSAFNQLESYLMGLPYLGLRDYTEQIEGLDKNVLICKNSKKAMKNFLKNYQKYRTKPISSALRPSKIIVDYLVEK